MKITKVTTLTNEEIQNFISSCLACTSTNVIKTKLCLRSGLPKNPEFIYLTDIDSIEVIEIQVQNE